MKLCVFWFCFYCLIQRIRGSIISQKIRPDHLVDNQKSFPESVSDDLLVSSDAFSSRKRNIPNRFELELYQNILKSIGSSSEGQATEIRFLKPSIGGEQELIFNISYLSNRHNVTKTHLVILQSKDKYNLSLSINGTVLLTSRRVGVVKFDVTDVIRELPKATSVLKIKVNHLPTALKNKDNSLIEELSPVIAVYENVNNVNLRDLAGNERKRRSTDATDVTVENSSQDVASNDMNSTATPTVCSLRPWIVDFSVIGWSFVLAPVSYQANVCTGLCPVPLSEPRLNSTNYAFIKNIYNSVTSGANSDNIPRACCTPTAYAPLSVLMLDEHGNAIIRRFPEMIVTACGCR